MGHSFGVLATSLAFEELPNLENRKLVLIAPATETERALENFFTISRANVKLKPAFRQLITELSQQSISYHSVSRVVKK